MTNLALVESLPQISANRAAVNEHFFNELVSLYSQDLQRYAHWLSGDKHTAEDLVQETLLRAWKSIHKLLNPKAAKGWLLTILRRENARRFERKQLQISDVPMEEIIASETTYDTSTEAFVLRRAINELGDEHRIPLVKQVIEGYSQKEIGQQLGISTAGAGTRLFRARNKLRETLAA